MSRPLIFWFSEDEACAIVDGLNTLISNAYPSEEHREDGEQEEVRILTALSKRIALRLGVY